jgi:hypothetical protein
MTHVFRSLAGRAAVAAALALSGVALTGCEQKEKVLDVKTPNKRVEVERSKDTGNLDVNVEPRTPARTEVETPRVKVEVERSKGDGLPKVDVHTNK